MTISLKTAAYALTGSVGLLSDVPESTLNLVTALMVLAILQLVSRPPDSSHRYGHSKAEYFSSGAEGAFILMAALGIIATAVPRLLHPQPLENLSLGMALSVSASVINLFVALLLMRVGLAGRSIVLEADGRHLMTDVWTSVGVLLGIAAVWVTALEPARSTRGPGGRRQHRLCRATPDSALALRIDGQLAAPRGYRDH